MNTAHLIVLLIMVPVTILYIFSLKYSDQIGKFFENKYHSLRFQKTKRIK